MNRHTSRILTLAAALAFALPAGAQTRYTYNALPYFGAALSNNAVLTNFNVDPVTYAYFGTVFRNNATSQDIRDPDWFDTTPYDIANNGTVVGYVDDVDSSFNLTALAGFIRTPDGRFTTYLYPGSVFTLFTACNEAGTVLGQQYDANYNSHQFLLRRDGTLQSLSFPGYENVFWSGLNNSETLLSSQYDPATDSVVGLIEEGGTVQTFGVTGATDTYPYQINNRGEIAGGYDIHSADYKQFEQHGFVLDANGRLNSLDYAYAWPATEDDSGLTFTFIKDEGTTVTAINDKGQVLGNDEAIYIYRAPGVIYLLFDARPFLATPNGSRP